MGGLKPDDHILDVGSGFGRMAVALTDYLSPVGRYEGIEIIPKGVDWCIANIRPKFGNFNFQLIDVKNNRYNPSGIINAKDFEFPFEDESFDFVFLTSVFTHMLPADLYNYLSEIARVIKRGGRSLITYFLLNQESRDLIKNGKSLHKLKHNYENCLIEFSDDPEHVIAYEENQIREWYMKHNLSFESVHYGNWCGRIEHVSHQDIVIGVKN